MPDPPDLSLQMHAAHSLEENVSCGTNFLMASSQKVCLEGFEPLAGSLPSLRDATRFILCLIYGDTPAELQSWEKLKRNAEIYRRYLAGEDSVVLGRAFGLSDRRVRDIIEHERKHADQ